MSLFSLMDKKVIGNIWKHKEIHLHLQGPPHHCRNSSQVCNQGCWQKATSPGLWVPQGGWDTSLRHPDA